MKKIKKRQVLEYYSKLSEYIELLKNCYSCKSIPDMQVFADCQARAIELGNLLEHAPGDYKEIVYVLENCCENIYQLSLKQDLSTLSMIELEELCQNIAEAGRQIELNYPPDRKQVVFLPYKASMWDSLESAWMDAKNDPDTDALVIPIPYFDRNPDGSPKEWHYEGESFPDYVEITDYRLYNLADEHPDITFIHNPYDDCNMVSSVHPDYYSSVLKDFTDKLVYIPYYVLDEELAKKENAKEYLRGLFLQPAIKNAHQVIAQSEDFKRLYVDILVEETGEEYREYWDSKILGMGSPKLDRINRISEQDVTIPEEWKKFIFDSDGNRRKIILYNTGLSGMLKNRENMLKKIKSVIKIFREFDGEIVLLWRPHPLLEATINAMLPELVEEYLSIKKEFMENGYGILDESEDIDRAVVLCSGYYGDNSSVVELCKAVGKPVMIQNVDVGY